MREFEILDTNLRATLRVFAQAKDSGEARDIPGVLLICSGVCYSTFNAALLTEPVESARELDRRVAIAGVYFRARGLPWSFWLCEDWLSRRVRSEADGVLWNHRCRPLSDLPGMAAERLLPPVRPLAELEYRRVEDQPTRFEFNHLMSVCFGIPFPISGEIYGSEQMWRSRFVGHLGYLDGNAVASAATLAAAGAVGIYSVATLPDHRRKGYAEAITRRVLEEARQWSGIERTVLEACPAAAALYERLGYRTVTRYTVFASE
jgi:GNAT superfamily N-acetyltransferase